MKKILGVTFGGLQRRTLELTLILLLITTLAFTGVSLYQNSELTELVSDTQARQQEAISAVSGQTMLQVQEGTLSRTVTLQAAVADADFSEVVNNAYILKSMAEGVLASAGTIAPLPVSAPTMEMDGKSCAFALCEDGVDFTKSEHLGLIANLAAPMIAMHSTSDKIDGCYIGLADGTFFCVDEKAAVKLDENGEPLPFPVRERPWYRGAVNSGDVYFTGIVKDMFSGSFIITCSVPVVVNGGILGVVGIDVKLDGINSFMQASSGTAVFIANSGGEIILSSDESGVFAANAAERLMDQSGSAALTSVINSARAEATGLSMLTIGGRDYYIAGAPVPTVGWAVMIAVEKELTQQPEKELLGLYDGINASASASFGRNTARLRRVGNLLFVLILILGVSSAFIAARRVAKPIENMTRDIVECGETGSMFEMSDKYRTNDEIELLAESFDNLSKKTKRYIEDITRITAEKERLGTELALATQIQSAMLPHIVPAFPDRTDFDIIGSMDPAKEVGGDFYDYFLIDDDHLGMLIADVSGKGVPAALFMMASKIILQSVAMQGSSPSEILRRTNTAICTNNEAEMFVTVWVGILELSTGTLSAANAGHEYPVIAHNGRFELFKDKHGFVLGGMAGVKYREYTVQLEPGDKLFVYTDGVPEATDENKELFGTERMLDALNRSADKAPDGILRGVREAVDDFVKDAEQFDDLTMLCLEYKGKRSAQ